MVFHAFSTPFPGDQIGFLKKKSLAGTIIVNPKLSIVDNLLGLGQFHFGLVRGGQIEDVLVGTEFSNKLSALNDLNVIDMLMADRMDLANIDKYTAGDLLITKRPHYIGKLEFIYPTLTSREFHVAFSKAVNGNQEVLKLFNQGLLAIKKDGTLRQILAKHGFFTPEIPSDAEPKKVKLVIGTVNNPDMLIMQKLSPLFEAANPTISIEWRVLDENILRQRLLSDLAISDGQFDVMTIGSYEAPIWAEMEWLTPIQNIPLDYDLDDIVLPVREVLSYNNRLYALPFYAESSVLYYRTDLFEAAGLTMPPEPTYSEVLDFAEKLHKAKNNRYGICLRGKPGWGDNITLITTIVNSFGGRWFDLDWKPQLHTDEWKNAITMYVNLLTKYGPPNPTKNGYIENLALFSQGKCAMWVDATIAAGRLYDPEISQVSENVGIVSAPIQKTAKGSHWLWIWSLAVPESSKHKIQALKFITWATSKQYVKLVGELEGLLAIPAGTRESSYLNEEYLRVAPFSTLVLDTIKRANVKDSTLKPKPYIGIQYVAINEFPSIGNQVGLLLEKVLLGELSIIEALEQSQKLTEKQMKASNYY